MRLPSLEESLKNTTIELLQAVLSALVYATGVVCILGYIAVNLFTTGQVLPGITLVLLVFSACAVLSIKLVSRNYYASVLVFLAGWAGCATLAVLFINNPELGFLYAILPLLAVMLLSWQAGLAAEGLVAVLLWLLGRSNTFPILSTQAELAILGVGGFCLGIGWAARVALLSVAQWSFQNYQRVTQEITEARDQRAQLQQMQEDLTHANRELSRLSERLKILYEAAEEAKRVKDQFVSNVSHELRTPLNMIIGFSEMIIQSPELYSHDIPPALLADMAAIERNSRHLSRLVDDVLALSQIDAGKMGLIKEWASVDRIVDEAVVAASPLFRSKRLYLEKEIEPNLPLIYCDVTRIRQVVLNLLSNAGRFTQIGGVKVSVWHNQDHLLISVADTGPGISPEEQALLFEPFQQLGATSKDRQAGSGLGLVISKNFLELHGGKMWLESQPGKGTIFFCSLPVVAPLQAIMPDASYRRWFNPLQSYEVRSRPGPVALPGTVPRFVVLEKGTLVLQRLLQNYLNQVEIIPVETPQEAFRQLSISVAQALIVNGSSYRDLDALQESLVNLPYRTPMLTCEITGEEAAAEKFGVLHYLVKPVTRAKMVSLLEELGEDIHTILLVDDQPEVLQLFSRMINSANKGHRVFQTTNAQRGLQLLRQRKPDVVFLDLVMPEIDGPEFLLEKNSDASVRNIPVVIITSRDPRADPVVTPYLRVTRGDGLSVRDLLNTIELLSRSLTSNFPSVGPEQPETPGG